MNEAADNLIRREDDAFIELALCYLDNEATREQIEQLDQVLKESPVHRQQFVTLAIQAQCMAEAVRPPAEAQRNYGKLENEDSCADVLMEVLEIEREAARRRAQERKREQSASCPVDSLDDRLRLFLGESNESVVPVRHVVIPRAAVYAVIGGLVATAAALVLAVYTMLFPPEPPRSPTIAENSGASGPVAAIPPAAMPISATRLVAAVNPQWAAGQKQWQAGEQLPMHQPFELMNGLLWLRFDNGAEVIVRGPARFELLSPTTLSLASGEVFTRCEGPSAHGFIVQTPYARIVDIGTEFGVRTDDAGTEAHVFSGRIVMTSLPDESGVASVTVPLDAGSAGRVTLGDPQIRTMEAARPTFIGRNDFDTHVLAESGSRYHRAMAFSHELRRDPALLAYYTFDADSMDQDRVRNVALTTAGRLDGIVTGAQPTARPVVMPGRFEQSRALNFTPIGNLAAWVEVPHDSVFESIEELTLMAWVRRAPHDGGTIVSKRASDTQVSFQMSMFGPQRPLIYTNALQFGSGNAASVREPFVRSDPVLENKNNWCFVVTTYRQGIVNFYVDGELITTRKAPLPLGFCDSPIRIGAAPTTLRTSGPDPFQGSIDELAIFNRALSPEEIQTIYQATRP